jgi:hypothetical protein
MTVVTGRLSLGQAIIEIAIVNVTTIGLTGIMTGTTVETEATAIATAAGSVIGLGTAVRTVVGTTS